jgi:hypothetical protein
VTFADLQGLVPEQPEPPEDMAHGDGGRTPASTVLVQIAQELFQFGVSDTGETFAVPMSGPKVVSMLRGGKTSLRRLLATEYYRHEGRTASHSALADALLVLEGLAQETDEAELHIRVADYGGVIWLDLGDHSGRAVRITSTGWTVELTAPVLFRRSALTSPLPEPETGGSFDDLWSWLNVTESDRPLIAAWLVAALLPLIPHPILSISGEQGSGKTTAQKVIVSLIDPSPVPTRKPPSDAESWVTAALGSLLVGLDNLSSVSDWLSDSLCRAVTGEGDVRRRLYTDGDLAVFAFRRCVILTGIDLGAVNGDLADRLLPIRLDVIAPQDRLEETEMWPQWQSVHPRILGALLTLTWQVLTALPSVQLKSKPRMADFARVLAAVDKVLGTDGMARYLATQNALASESLTGDQFLMAMLDTLEGTFEGTSAELLEMVPKPNHPPKEWPGNARRLTQRLNRQAPVMRKVGWTIENDNGANKTHTTRWKIRGPLSDFGDISPSPPSPQVSPPPEASMTSLEYGESLASDMGDSILEI